MTAQPTSSSSSSLTSLRRVLIANRGEIAIRIGRAAAGLGVESVAIYAAVDADALHTRLADRSHQLQSDAGPVGAYLDIDAVLAAAAATDCDCVHPGYGFLSESAAFAARCAEAGLIFIGPSPDALALFGDKVAARSLAQSLGIPVVSGSDGALANLDQARAAATAIGYPVMVKAAAGGGGRGMRAVGDDGELAEAFERCRSEAEAAFGDGSVFLEKLVVRPRHIEVQVLADRVGNVIHLHERDCSVQLRNQKVIELAPAPGLDVDLRAALHADAVRLVTAAGYHNAGTVEFLVVPETGEYYFIECNPRIQVEHTVTEQVTGVDLVETQFRLAAGATLAELGWADQAAVGQPRGFSVQARVVATAGGTITAYKEPSGVGVRVDAAGYAGYSPPPQFDPLLAKVIASTFVGGPGGGPGGGAGDVTALASVFQRARRALGEFHLLGLPTNLAQLQAILGHSAVLAGDARTTLLAEAPELAAPAITPSPAGSTAGTAGTATTPMLALLNSYAGHDGNGANSSNAANAKNRGVGGPAAGGLVVGDGEEGVASPLEATLVAWRVQAGDTVAAGDALVTLNAMKMETVVVAPCDAEVTAVAELQPGQPVSSGLILVRLTPVVLDPDSDTARRALAATAVPDPDAGWGPVLEDVRTLHRLAEERLAPGSTDPGVVRQRSRNKLTCRERIDLLLDTSSFREVGSVAGFASHDEGGAITAFTPANHVGGWGRIEGRAAVVCADDFTSRGGHSDGAIGAKSFHLDRMALELRIPSVRLLDGSSGGGSVASMVPEQRKAGESTAQESSGAITAGRPRVSGGGGSFLPGHLGSTMYTEQLATVPVVNLLLGSVVGIGAAKAVLGHFSVMVRDIAQLFVAGPPVVSHAMGYDITKEDLGGWHIHCRNGSVDNLAETEAEAMDQARRFLSYLPGSVFEAPPVLPISAADRANAADRRDDELFSLIPRKRTTTFDIRRAITLMADRGSFFEIGPHWGTDQVVGFVRFKGHPLGVIASDSRHVNGGALTADGCDKVRRHLDVCDLFHIPILNLVDNPGFAVGLEHEQAGTIRKGAEWMVAFAQITVPLFTVVMRRSFGVAGNNWATPQHGSSMRVCWPSADVGGIPPEGGIEAAYKRQLAESADPVALRAELEARIESARGPLGPLSKFQIEEMIDPRDTRRYVCEWLDIAYRMVSAPSRLVSRPQQFRP
ncbi:MAG: carboxyl transferase domain-containing protein [Acidimicrobiales bacterium]